MDDKKLDLNLLLALEALLAERNVTRAARRLNLSQPALSAQLTRLRDTFGDRLMIPTSRGMNPTALALELESPLREALDRARSVVRRAKAFDPASAEITFTIAASDYMQVAVLLPFLVKLNTNAPGLRLMVRILDIPTVASELERGEIDIAFVQPVDVDGPGLRSTTVLRDRYIGIIRRNSLGTDGMSLERFLDARHIIVSLNRDGFAGPTDVALAAIGMKRNVAFAVASFVFLIESVSRCDLVALVPQRLTTRYLDRIDTFEPPVAVPGIELKMLWHDRTHDHPGYQWLRSEFEAFCARH